VISLEELVNIRVGHWCIFPHSIMSFSDKSVDNNEIIAPLFSNWHSSFSSISILAEMQKLLPHQILATLFLFF
jgi:hypothetical protein